MTQGLTFAVLGHVRALHNGVDLPLGPPQQRTTLAILLLARGRVVATDELCSALWGYQAPRAARGTIRTYVHRLRRILEVGGEDIVHSTSGGYALRVPEDAVDLGRFRHHVRAAEAAKATGDREGAAEHLHQALAQWHGQPLADLSSEFADSERGRLVQRRVAVLEELAALELDLGLSPDILPELTEAAAAEPLRERLHELLMLSLCRAGRQAEALNRYETLRRQLSEALGVDPGPALRELHGRILRGDPGLLAPPPPAAPPEPVAATPMLVPAQLPVDLRVFTGRTQLLGELLRTVRPGPEAPGVVVVHGMPGVGKTTFAVRVAHQLAPRFPDGQLYLDLRGFEDGDTAVDPADALWTFLDALGVPSGQLPNRLDTLTALYRSVLSDRRCLVMLDNARDTRQVLPLLPGNSRSLVMITSRGDLSGLVAGTGAHTVPLDLLTVGEAVHFLELRLGSARVAAEPEAVSAIVQACARLPLALAVVAARAALHPGFSLGALAQELAEARGGLDAFTGSDSGSDVRSILSWSYRALTPEAARLFRLLSLYPGQVIETRTAASIAGIAPSRANALLRELTAAHLVQERQPGQHTWHELLRAYAGERLAEEDTAEEIRAARIRTLWAHVHSAARALLRMAPYPDHPARAEPAPDISPREFGGYQEALQWFASHHSVLVTMIERAAAHGLEDAACRLSWSLRYYLDWAGHWRDLEHVNTVALAAADRIGDRVLRAYALRGLARVDCHQGRFTQAQGRLAEALDCYDEAGEVTARAFTLRQRLGVYQLESKFEQALTTAQEALDLFRQTGCESGQGGALVGVAASLTRLGRHAEAIPPALDALALLEAQGELYSQGSVLEVLSHAYYSLGRYDEAGDYRQRALDHIRDMGHMDDLVTSLLHRMTTSSLIYIAEARHAGGRFEEANAALREGLTSLSAELTETYRAVSRYDEAKATLRETLAAVAGFLGEPEDAEWYTRASAMLHKTIAVAEELGLGAYILDTG
ncbi:DNA-binding SARP family transcriptional activator [Crossiella equi]|uniref:DNA-binding SARP family transcriptional activator n=1 Tax=Crossiella equi TaxID=130796 RepID=A0ABS5A6T9_9PSEU|nr:BTAD domain-containing putative transcriptional regulator [Crossiella equi]MBP2472308.1 DNA-binding SARP family transcriptional activator [Crossiella equi]